MGAFVGLVILCGVAGCAAGGGGIVHQPAINALGPYSGAVITTDDAPGLIFVSGKIGERGGTFPHEVTTAIDAVEDELRRAGASLDDVLSVTVFLTDMSNYAAFNELYAARFTEPWPARAVVGVSALPGGARVEIQVIAAREE